MSTNKMSLFLKKVFAAGTLVVFMVVLCWVTLNFVAIHLAASGLPYEDVVNKLDIFNHNSRLIMLGGFLSLFSLMKLHYLREPSFKRRFERRQDIKEALKLNNVVKSYSKSTSEEIPAT